MEAELDLPLDAFCFHPVAQWPFDVFKRHIKIPQHLQFDVLSAWPCKKQQLLRISCINAVTGIYIFDHLSQ